MDKQRNSRKRQRTTVRTHSGLHFADVDFNHNEPRFYIYRKGKEDFITVSEINEKLKAGKQNIEYFTY